MDMHTDKRIHLSAPEEPRFRHLNLKNTAPDCLNLTSTANIRKVLLTDINAVNSHVKLNFWTHGSVRGPFFPSKVQQGIEVLVSSV